MRRHGEATETRITHQDGRVEILPGQVQHYVATRAEHLAGSFHSSRRTGQTALNPQDWPLDPRAQPIIKPAPAEA